MKSVEVILGLVGLGGSAVPQVGEEFDVTFTASDVRSDARPTVFSFYTDVSFDPSILSAVGIDYNDDFTTGFYSIAQTGTINNDLGTIEEVGASALLASPLPFASPVVFTVRFKVLKAGRVTIGTNPGESQLSETVVFGRDTDQRNEVKYGSLELDIAGATNESPVANNDTASTIENNAVTIDVLSNDSDADGDILSVTEVEDPANGAAAINNDGSIAYTPDAGFSGIDVFSYTISDGAESKTASVTVSVGAVNDAPVGINDAVTTDEDTVATGNALTNDSDPDGDALTAVLATGPSNGSASINPDGSFEYTPNANFNGADSFTYTVSDGVLTDTATVNVTVNSVNDVPVAVDDGASTTENNIISINVLGNNTDVDGDALSVTGVDDPANGAAVINNDGTIAYTPDAGFSGTDTFSYTVSDGTENRTASVTVSVDAVNDAPVAVNDAVITDEDSVANGNVLTNDSDPDSDALTAALANGPVNGSVDVNSDGSYEYTPNANFNGTDSFTYTVSDGVLTNTATVNVVVSPVNNAPVAVNDSASTTENNAVTIDVLSNDSDIDGDTLSVTEVGGPANGSAIINNDGTIAYTPDAGFNGTDTFSYTVSDGTESKTASVAVSIGSVNDAPAGTNDTVTIDEDTIATGNVLTNDTDVDDDVLTASLAGGPSNGSVDVNSDGSFEYTPNANFNGSDSFTYTVSDGVLTDTATANVTVNPVNDAPVAVNDSAVTTENNAVTIDVLSNDSDIDGDALAVTGIEDPANGSAIINNDGTISYTPNAGFSGTDMFSYIVSDGAESKTASVTVSVGAVNDTPVGTNDTVTTDEDSVANGNVLTNDNDLDGDALTAALATGPSNGSVDVNSDGSFEYTPNANFNGSDSFTYTVSDGVLTDTATVNVTVNPVNDVPETVNDSASTTEGNTVAIDVLSNDSDADGDILSVTEVEDPANGAAAINNDGSIAYTPDAGFSGIDVFSYTISDGTESKTASVTVSVGAVNDAPVGINDAVTTDEDTVATGNVLTNDTDLDGDALTAALATDPANGSVNVNSDGSFEYTPNANFNGADSFTYTVSDGVLTNTATVNVTVNSANDAPVAVDDSAFTTEGNAVTINVLNNDADIDGDALSVTGVENPANGAAVINSDGTIAYIPDAGFSGTDTFSYTVSDGTESKTASVTVSVDAVNDAPLGTNDAVTIDEDSVATGNALTNDSDPDGDALTAVLATGPSNGSASINPDGSFEYTPNANFNGADSFTYTVSDGVLTDTATVNVTVNSVNDVPVAVDDGASTTENNIISINVLGNNTDVDGDALSVTGVDDPANGAAVINNDGTIAYTPDAGFSGTDTFSYTVSDGTENRTASVTVSVDAVNDAPVAVNDAVITDEDSVANGNVLTNDSDPDSDALTAALANGPVNGSVDVNSDGSYEYTPNANFNGTDSFTYTVSDGVLTNTATVNVVVSPVNDAPVAVNDSASTTENNAVTIDVLSNDSDIDGDTLSVTEVGGPANGSAIINNDGTIAYTPDAGFNGTDTFSYTVSDGTESKTASVAVSIGSVNDAPAGTNDTVTIDEDTIATGNVLTNDTDVDDDVLTASLAGGPSNGSVDVNSDGSFEYTPNTNFNGSDSFTYTVSDGVLTDTATANVTVNPINDAPVAVNDSAVTTENNAVTIDVLSNDSDIDGDALFVTEVEDPGNGFTVNNDDGTIDYIPDAGFNGTDTFSYTISDGIKSETATVSVSVNAINDVPVATDDAFSGAEDTTISGNVLDNDNDVDNDSEDLTASLLAGPANGNVVINNDGSFIYTPDANFNGDDSFAYTVSDGAITDTGTVILSVDPVNDIPVAVGDSSSTTEDTAVVVDVLSNDSDIDGDALGIEGVGAAASGVVFLNGDGTLTYTPNARFSGIDSFTYTVNDGNGGISEAATVSVSVEAVDDEPTQVPGTTSGSDVLIGDSRDNVLIGLQGRDILTGGGGNDEFVYTNIFDGGDIITDFEVGSDKIVVTSLLESLGYAGTDPLGDGYIRSFGLGSNTLLQVDLDGNAGPARGFSLALVQNVTEAELNNADNFIF